MKILKDNLFNFTGDINMLITMIFQALEPGNVALRHHAEKGSKR